MTAEKNKLQEEEIMELLSQNKTLAHEKWVLDCEKIQLIAEIDKTIKMTHSTKKSALSYKEPV